ncbi:hypothetical protein SAMN02949497_2515 [Methylomagnum ishizawai]|uniref:Uncharacterized protein n=1 Tax=Methylomagnum ishizawai TaxID=1760988 RepID=A0A1Y6CWX3_9GAMM|nr:hypothetical protein [Methylomagnum ishizawai]SMF95169.1 hypothetical protein SAMN02949497_2515 [Methylomagnum ishizawai]
MTKQETDKPLPEKPGIPDKADTGAKKGHTKTAIWPTFRAAYTDYLYSKAPPGSLDMAEITRELQARNDEVWDGDLRQLEAMLNTQAHSLDAMFHALAERAALNMGKNLGTTETYLKLAFRAQNQCARTLEALATMKNPSVVIAQQANIAQGHQQVNNGTATSTPPRTRPAKNTGSNHSQVAQNKLITEPKNGETLDGRGTGAAIGTMPPIAPMVELDRAKNAGGQSQGRQQCIQGRREAHLEGA